MQENQSLGKCIWSDNWCIDGNQIWFMSGEADILFQLDVETKIVKMVSHIPTIGVVGFRRHPIILKNDDVIYCLPDCGEDIWCYHLEKDLWTKIPITNPNKVRVEIENAWVINGRMYTISNGLKQVIEVDTDDFKVIKYYNIANKDQEIGNCVLAKNSIYIVETGESAVYKFDVDSKTIQKIILPQIADNLNTICYDGQNFWLSGRCLKIYRWNEEVNDIAVIDDFPSNFGIYNFAGKYSKSINYHQDSIDDQLFLYSVYAGDKIWFIPFRTNEILYMEKGTMKINVFSIDHELQDEEDIKTQFMDYKYILEYVKDDRYIGLFSLKNKWTFEIDSQNMDYRVLDCVINKKDLYDIEKSILDDTGKNMYPAQESPITSFSGFLEYVCSI